MAAVGLPEVTPPTGVAHDEKLRLRFIATRVEPNLAAPFFARGGALGSACARAETDFSLSGAEFCTSAMVNEAARPIEVELPASAYTRDVDTGAILISSRLRLNVTTSRLAAAINGTITGTLSGQGSIPVYELFTEAIALSEAPATTGGEATTGDSAAGAAADADAATAAPAEVRVSLPFEQIPMSYGSWDAHSAVIGTAMPAVVAFDPATGAYTEPQDVRFIVDERVDGLMKLAEPTLQAIYDAAWKTRKSVVYEKSKNLTKAVMRVPAGFNGGGFCLSASVCDAPFSQSFETLEDLVAAGVAMQVDDARERAQLLEELAVPSYAATVRHAQTLGTALSYTQANQMPYRVDGTPILTPEGAEMKTAESWRFEASKRRADDCDGSAANIEAAIRQAEHAESLHPGEFPHLRAVANSLGAHYVHGVSVIGANAGHADAADTKAKAVTGHAVAISVDKTRALLALKRGGEHEVDGQPPDAPERRAKINQARVAAWYPPSLVRRMPAKERAFFESIESIESLVKLVPHATNAQPLFHEGTTPASSRAYTHDASERDERARTFALDKEIGTAFAPNVLRMAKLLDSAPRDDGIGHAFYSEFVELLVSPTSGLMQDKELRELESATCHLLFCKPVAGKPTTVAGASPRDIATGDFAMVPLWRVGAKIASIVDSAHAESVSNAIPRRAKPDVISASGAARLDESLAHLETLRKAIATETPIEEREGHCMLYMASFDSMLRNPAAIEHFGKIIAARKGVVGDVVLHPIRGVAVRPSAEGSGTGALLAEAGVFAQVSLWVK